MFVAKETRALETGQNAPPKLRRRGNAQAAWVRTIVNTSMNDYLVAEALHNALPKTPDEIIVVDDGGTQLAVCPRLAAPAPSAQGCDTLQCRAVREDSVDSDVRGFAYSDILIDVTAKAGACETGCASNWTSKVRKPLRSADPLACSALWTRTAIVWSPA